MWRQLPLGAVSRRMRSRLAVAFIALAALFSLIGCGSNSAPTSNASSAESAESTEPADVEPEELLDESDPAFQLAVIDVSAAPTADDIAPYTAALKRMRKVCDNSRSELADYTVNARRLIRENGGDEPELIDVLDAVHEAATVDPGGDCDDEYLLYVTTMTEE